MMSPTTLNNSFPDLVNVLIIPNFLEKSFEGTKQFLIFSKTFLFEGNKSIYHFNRVYFTEREHQANRRTFFVIENIDEIKEEAKNK